LQEALALKKYAFASDVIRLAVLFEYGGVYLDTDVKLLKSFDSFLNNKSFIGKELPLRLSTAVIGAEPGLQWIKDFLYSYTIKGKHFIGAGEKFRGYHPIPD
jgi:mannosyltransferase OCH1-like enzyme